MSCYMDVPIWIQLSNSVCYLQRYKDTTLSLRGSHRTVKESYELPRAACCTLYYVDAIVLQIQSTKFYN